jgi:prepilin signal peptidase PulO-like enzyme (type II secretory pathway)
MGIMAFVLGLCVGSFLNMLSYRTAVRYKLKHQNLKLKNKERSFCDFCGKQLSWYENIPVFSWVFLRGKSKCCGKKLPVEYPIVEIVIGIIFLLNYQSPINVIILSLLVFSLVFDLKYMILPDFSTYILIGLSGLLMAMNGHTGPFLLSGLGAFLFLLILHVGTKGRGMGFGDVKLAVFMGLYLGFPGIIVSFYVAFIVGAIVGVSLMIMKKAGRKTVIPFGPFLILGTVLARFIIKI